MYISPEENSKAHELLREIKKKETIAGLVPVRISSNTIIMMQPSSTKKEIQAKIKKYTNRK